MSRRSPTLVERLRAGEGEGGMTHGGHGTLTVVVPELGQVVRCRDRIWAVNEVVPSSLPEDAISGVSPQHLVRMSSLEDDGFGDELTVLWELEPGTQVIPHQALPRPETGRLDRPDRLEAFL